MGAYENPNSARQGAKMSQIAQQQQAYISAMIRGFGMTAANVINSKKERQTAEFNATQEAENKRELKLLGLEDKVRINAGKSGISNDSFFEMANGNINNKEKWTTALGNATDVESRQEASYQLDMANKRSNAINQYVGGYKDWFKTYSGEISGTNRNKPGGVYTGNIGPDASEFDKQTYKNWALKNALVGVQLKENEDALLPPVEFYQKEDGTVMGKLEGYDDFDIMATIQEPPVQVFDLKKDLTKQFNSNNYLGSDGVIQDKFLDTKNPTIVGRPIKNLQDVDMIERDIPIKPTVMNAWMGQVNQKLAGIFGSINTKEDFRNLQATYLSIAGDKDRDGKRDVDADGNPIKIDKLPPLVFKDGFYQLDPKSEAAFREVYLKNATDDFFGPGYITVKEFAPEPTVQKEPKPTDVDKRVEQIEAIPSNTFGLAQVKGGILYNAPIDIPQQGDKNYVGFKDTLDNQGFDLKMTTDGDGYEVITKGNVTNAPKSFKIFFDEPPSGKSFYRDLFLAMGVKQGDVNAKLNKYFKDKNRASNLKL